MWNVIGTSGELASPPWHGAIELTRPWQGFCPPEDSVGFDFLLGVWFNDEISNAAAYPVEMHARGTDLIASYAENQSRDVRPEFLWRFIELAPQAGTGLELIASAQSSKLSSDPHLETRSRISSGQVFRIGNSELHQRIDLDRPDAAVQSGSWEFFLIRPDNIQLSYAEFVHPSDFVRTEVRAVRETGLLEISHDLFAQSLEKGVIRRGRVRGIFLPREKDIATARAQFDCFANSKPLLSA